MTSFFIPRFENDSARAEEVYEDLRVAAKEQSGSSAHSRRIQSMMCRLEGADRTINVGDVDAIKGKTVIAILQVGRESFTLHCEDSTVKNSRSTIEISRRTVYDVTDFES